MKCGIIYDNSKDLWHSLKNLESVDSLSQRDFIFFPFNSGYGKQTTYYSHYKLAKEVLALKPDYLFFNAERPHPTTILNFLNILDSNYKPQTGIRLFGNFQESLEDWLQANNTLKRLSIFLSSPSESQTNFIKQFLNTTSIVHTFPHPVKKMSFNLQKRNQARAKLKLSAETIFLYSGRLTLQKNIHYIFEFIGQLKKINHPLIQNGYKVFIAGPQDDKGAPALNIAPIEGTYYQKLIQSLNDYPLDIKENIIFTGNLNREELEELYNAADFLVNFSLNHAEAFGVAIAEALSTGLPCFLSSWGGHGDFIKNFPTACFPISPRMNQYGLNLRIDSDFLESLPKKISTLDQRIMTSKNVQHFYNDKHLSHMVDQFLNVPSQPFSGFSEKLQSYIKARNSFSSFDSKTFEYQNTFKHFIPSSGNESYE